MKLITNQNNLKYLINFTGTSGFLLLGRNKNYFFTDFRYKEIAKKLERSRTRIPFKFIELDEKLEKNLKKLTGKTKKIEFEANDLTVSQLKSWKKKLKGRSLVPMKKSIEEMRMQKDQAEIKLIKQSQEINDKAFNRIKKLFKKGVTEREIAWQIKLIGHELGAEDISFEPIVAFGPNSAIPHHQNTNRKLKARDIILIDMGMKFKSYCSDMTRTIFKGKPSPEQIAIYEKVLKAQEKAITAIKPGTKCSTIDKIARKSMGNDSKYFGHSLGHGIGLEVHENPGLNAKSKLSLKENMVITVEPGIYLPGKFGIRIEDMGQVKKNGYKNFTKSDKKLTILPS